MEVERTTKWLKMLKSWDKYKNSEKVISHLTGGDKNSDTDATHATRDKSGGN